MVIENEHTPRGVRLDGTGRRAVNAAHGELGMEPPNELGSRPSARDRARDGVREPCGAVECSRIPNGPTLVDVILAIDQKDACRARSAAYAVAGHTAAGEAP